MPNRTRVVWEGSQLVHHSLALVNRELCLRLDAMPGIELSLRPYEPDTIAPTVDARFPRIKTLENRPLDDVDVHVRHQWPLDLHPPDRGRWVIMQPWEYGAVPRAWYDAMKFGADEVWVPSTFNKECYVESGIPEERVHVVPLGTHEVFGTEPRPFPLRTRKTFRFLFVGGLIPRKGIDLLLDAYITTFSRRDDVCLVIKGFGAGSFYRGRTLDRQVREIQERDDLPEIEYLDGDLSFEELRDLYHACHCLVHPYRGEGFGLPIAEAMACGLPVIVPDRGGASDFCTPTTAVLVPSVRREVPATREGILDTVATAWWLEVDRNELRERMRQAYDAPGSLDAIAAAGQAWVRERFTWEAAAGSVAGRIVGLAGRSGAPLHADTQREYDLRIREGVACWERGDRHRSLRQFALAAAARPTRDARFNLAAALIETGDPAAALRYLTELADGLDPSATGEDGPSAIEVLNAMAICRMARGDLAGARAEFERALAIDPDDTTTRQNLEYLESGAAAPDGHRDPAVTPRLRWTAPAFNASGYADEARAFLLGLAARGWPIQLRAMDAIEDRGILPSADLETLLELTRNDAGVPEIEVQHLAPDTALPPAAPVSVIRTMFETDRIAPDWADRCNRFTEVWVPTEFNRETFARAGVVPEKIRVLPGAIDVDRYDPEKYTPASLPKARGFRFLTVFDWTARKGWDLLLRSYFEEFGAEEDVTLVIKVTNFHDARAPEEVVREFIRKHDFREAPHFLLVDRKLPTDQLIALYLAADAFVLPSRGEGWGRPYMEAMALGIPTIGTRWSGNLAFMNDENSFLVEIDGLERADRQGWDSYRGHLWAAPSIASIRTQMRRVFEDPEEAARRAARAQRDIRCGFGIDAVAARVERELRRAAHR